MRIASGQFSAGTDVEANLERVVALLGEAAAGGAELLVLPEMSGYATSAPPSALAAAAQPLDGPFIAGVAAAAAARSVAVVVGTIEENPDGLPFNTLVAISAEGEIVATYRKVHLYDAFGYAESDGITAGEITEPFVLDLGDLRLGAMTCYDLRFPESARRLIDAGANVILLPAMWITGPGKEDAWTTLVRARAIENTAYVVSANQTGPLATGNSIVVDPAGVVVAAAGEAPGLVFADLEGARIEAVRARVPSLANRRFGVVPLDAPASAPVRTTP
ncbi:carbon-nitrogen hydrolase family protein [Plantibacter flavus]|uniref:carbon-nitrogen hydrolase family protein n=1 Tax=Plantibacter flavus TaxID=150123 RepID=UPI003F1828EB